MLSKENLCILVLTFIVSAKGISDFLGSKPTYLEGKVGSYVVFNCPIDYPQDIEIPFILHWNKDVRIKKKRNEKRNIICLYAYSSQLFPHESFRIDHRYFTKNAIATHS